jgi:alginate O-acetyltransferase complex protein AlgI
VLLLASIGLNFYIGRRIGESRTSHSAGSKVWLWLGVSINLGLLAYYKYANFFVDNLSSTFDLHWQIERVVLPIGISFFSFTQIAFLADAYLKGVRELRFSHYGLFVTYFPHLVAGPVLHHAQMMPQFADAKTYQLSGANVAAGLSILLIGLFKKVVLADGIAPYADAIFQPADAGLTPDAWEAWMAALAYSLQLYFDFSGYSDMAIGISLMFNVRLPFNFNSPYQAQNISDFWRRWHISLSDFLRDYLYIALGGNRRGPIRRYLNLATTMVLGGLWHGASWSFVLWGALHGCYLMINHGFRALCGPVLSLRLARNPLYRLSAWGLTMLSVVVAWVFFRAETLTGALALLKAMVGVGAGAEMASGVSHGLLWAAGLHMNVAWSWCLALGAWAAWAPNSNRVGLWLQRELAARVSWRSWALGFSVSLILVLMLVNLARDSVSAFIYFNF